MTDRPAPATETSLVSHVFAWRRKLAERRWLAYLLGAALALLAFAGRLLIGTKAPTPLLPFYPAMLVAAVLGGRGPAWLCAAVSGIGVWYFVLEPFHSFDMPRQFLSTSALFALLSALIIEISERFAAGATDLRERQLLLEQERDALARREADLSDSLFELQALYDQAPIGLGFLDRDLRFVRINAALAEMNGFSPQEHIGRWAWDLVPELREQAEPVLRQVIERDEPVSNVEIVGETPAEPGVTRNWLELFYPVHGREGVVQGIGVFCEEVTEQRRAAERERLLMREVDHRARNVLAVVQSVVRLTRSTGSVDEFKTAVEGRIQALARVHALLAKGRWEGVHLHQLVADELAPFPGAVTIAPSEPAVFLRPAAAQSLSMILHELATNSAKHGAIGGGGHVDVRWSAAAMGGGSVPFELEWLERGGPPVRPPERTGFGSTLIRSAVERQLGGELDYRLETGGLSCRMSLPGSVLAANAGPDPASG